ncbi:hypothetical protein DL546_003892 [Coniochaeta pulveracea]|uniref:Uncharacterized protein n=1 Tax=Coniochaeta pulveracea TaxID=177199 RepID=A0A420Y1Y5_9PEZI|nr:hypothetical protein DL546_003892 [Coniochaeta pulveracea]
MADASPQDQPPASTGPNAQPEVPYYGTPEFLHYAAIGIAVLGPIAYFTPSTRRGASSTIQRAILASGSFYAINLLAFDYTGRSIIQRSEDRWGKILGTNSSSGSSGLFDPLPEKAKQTKIAMDAARAAREAALPEEERRKLEERRRAREEGKKGLISRIWYGGEDEDWKKKRLEEDQKAIQEGKGYGDIIMDQIWEEEKKNE